jgi:hypothetical protein
VYIDLMQKTKDLTPGGERAERGYKVWLEII